MAKLINVCGSLCIFLLFLRIVAVLSESDKYVYDITPQQRSVRDVKMELLEEPEMLEPVALTKRSVTTNNPSDTSLSTTQFPPRRRLIIPTQQPNGNSSSSESPAPAEGEDDANRNSKLTTNKTENEANASKAKSPKTTKTAPVDPVSGTVKIPLLKEPTKNLGVNGSGIRKNLTPDVSDVPVTTNVSTLTHQIATLPPIFNDDRALESGIRDKGDFTKSNFRNVDNSTLRQHNITESQTDSHIFYNSTIETGEELFNQYWVDLDKPGVQIHDVLSESHRRAATITLSFDFPYYGHFIRNITITTGGFLYTGDYIHAWLAATQYIAPLMANFDMSLSNDSFVKYYDNGTALTVMWENAALQDRPNDGEFTFQATLLNTGDMYFVYKNVPVVIENIYDEFHPVKVGLSDAYIIDRTIYFVRKKTIYEYHKVQFQKQDIKNYTVIHLIALPTCLSNNDCTSCLTAKIDNFTCMWCPALQKCSSGIDRFRHSWLLKGCDKHNLSNETACSHMSDYIDEPDVTYTHDSGSVYNGHISGSGKSKSSRVYQDPRITQRARTGMGVTGIIAVLFLMSIVAAIAVWIMYAYRNPHTTSGQILIRYRPTQWRWKRGEARYTAATIHM